MAEKYEAYLEKMNSDFDKFETFMDEKVEELPANEFFNWFFNNNYVILPYTEGLHKRVEKLTKWETDNLFKQSFLRHKHLMDNFYAIWEQKRS